MAIFNKAQGFNLVHNPLVDSPFVEEYIGIDMTPSETGVLVDNEEVFLVDNSGSNLIDNY